MDRLISLLAAAKAGKLPSQTQILWSAQWFKMTLMTQLEDDALGPRAQLLLKDLYNFTDALVNLGEQKNPDNLFQNVIHRCMTLLARGFRGYPPPSASDPTAGDSSSVAQPLTDLMRVAWTVISNSTGNDWSWTNMGTMALRELAQLFFENHIPDSSQSSSSPLFGVYPRLKTILAQISRRAHEEESYRQALIAFFDLLRTWAFESLTQVGGFEHSGSSSGEASLHLLLLLCGILERFAGKEPTYELFASIRVCASTISQNPPMKQWLEDVFAFAQLTLEQEGLAGSDDWHSTLTQLKERWTVLSQENPTWKESSAALLHAWNVAIEKLLSDPELHIVFATWNRLVADVKKGIPDSDRDGFPAIWGKVTWLWQDIFKVVVPSILAMIRDIPIPRVEYYDTQTEFVLENLDLSTLRINPAHLHISNVSSLELVTNPAGETKSMLSVITCLKAQGIRFALNKLSFWYRDKTATYGPSDYSGRICNLVVPSRGLDLDMRFKLIPANPGTSTSAERVRRRAFHVVEKVQVSFVDGENMDFDIEDCNHTVLLSLFKPLFITRLRQALERSMTEQVRLVFEGLDTAAWDVFQMTQQYVSVGMGFGPSVQSAVEDEWDRFKHDHTGPEATGTTFTSSGVIVRIRDRPTNQVYGYAIGSEPQILGPEKRGPGANRSNQEAVPGKMGSSLFGGMLGTLSDLTMGESLEDPSRSGAKNGNMQQKVDHIPFSLAVKQKTAMEKSAVGWESRAFDVA